MPNKEKPPIQLFSGDCMSPSRSLEFLKKCVSFKVVPVHTFVYYALIYFRISTST